MAVAANKSDMYEYEEVTEEEGIAFAKQHNAIFQSTSAKDNSNGSVDLLFKNIGKSFLIQIQITKMMQGKKDQNYQTKTQEKRKRWMLLNFSLYFYLIKI